MTERPEIKAALAQAILDGDAGEGAALAQRALDAGLAPAQIFDECVVPTLKDVGDRFSRLELFLPEMMMSAEAVKEILAVLEPVMKAQAKSLSLGTVVIGSAAGDIHDIGRNMVTTMLEINGFQVIDLGGDVNPQVFLKAARERQADVIAVSSLLTTSLPYVKDLFAMLRETGEYGKFKVMIGGGSVNSEFAEKVGAHGYGKDAAEAVTVARRLAGR
jgi:corrinoid protein of di/trimethylamine methyltransferase